MDRKKRGRPLIRNARRNQVLIRLNDEEAYKLEMMSFDFDESRSEVIRKALKLYYESVY